ncbi:hypothetical protein [Chryseobacterium rhizosphaerae]|uniref:Uncharacterized protein n=1 Tax=Chryseobacterium rhizosphaerae TaxID=395937 RepID=A0ABX9IPR0_9FLAO|nr:hypothetical protein [Chryseobacterium rhizosphaerae]MDC8102492.1 hypothetical protein [Chryseobacterium rhizosphaerae]MDR6548738.1 hypothetical protein [Chryseobacterium rhizosphaerae]REC77849.1 hypothetical protein DRF57_04090 [Chryseobacterium rhizosphaerae]GEN68697.1 hypothetical protein CRH01_32650 [Chryseobacterium rhizosphaerae]
MKSFLKALTEMFSKYDPDNDIVNFPLKKYHGRIEINKALEVGNCRVHYSPDYAFETPVEVQNRIKDNTLLWIDNQNSLLGFSDQNRTLLVPLNKINGIEIQNMLKGRGPAESCLWIYLYEKSFVTLSISPEIYYFDQYEDAIHKTTGFTVTFSPEFYNA